MKPAWKPIVPKTQGIPKLSETIPHKLGQLPSFCNSKNGIAKSKFRDEKRIHT